MAIAEQGAEIASLRERVELLEAERGSLMDELDSERHSSSDLRDTITALEVTDGGDI
jgi:hypothetical protein